MVLRLGAQRFFWEREEEGIALTLMVAFKMMMVDVLGQRPS
jgi:hypothetical protein